MSSVRTATSTKMARPSRTRRDWSEAFDQRQLMDPMNVRRSFCGPLAERPMMRTSLASQGTRPFVDCSEERRLRLEERMIGGARRATVTGFATADCPTTICQFRSSRWVFLVRWWGGVKRRLVTGTMTMGSHHTHEESFALLDFAFENGVTLFDTAEMYPVPQCSETHGRSEEILGQWMRQHQRQQAPTSHGSFLFSHALFFRDRVVVSTNALSHEGLTRAPMQGCSLSRFWSLLEEELPINGCRRLGTELKTLIRKSLVNIHHDDFQIFIARGRAEALE